MRWRRVQSHIYRGLSLANTAHAASRGPKALAKRAGRIALGRASGQLIRKLLG